MVVSAIMFYNTLLVVNILMLYNNLFLTAKHLVRYSLIKFKE